jgi:prepilin-type N-terminal cleavage/methylation domain-containing protein
MSRRNERGFSLVEVVIASGILGLVVLAIYSLLHASTDSYQRDTVRQTLQDNARRAMDEITADLRDADSANVLITKTTATTNIRFRKAIGYDATASVITWSSYFEYETIPITIDVNVNHLQDDYRLVRKEYDSANTLVKTTQICEFLQPGALSAVRNGGKVDLSLTLYCMVQGKQNLSLTIPNSVALRNQ